MLESLTRFGATPPSTRLPPFPFKHVVLHKELKGTRDETSRARKIQKARDNHPIIKTLTRLRLLPSVVYLPTCWAIFDVDEPGPNENCKIRFLSLLSLSYRPISSWIFYSNTTRSQFFFFQFYILICTHFKET